MTDLRQTKEYSKYMESLGWTVEKIGNIQIYLRKILFGSVMKIQRPDKLSERDIELIELLAKNEKVFQIIIEPTTLANSKLLMANSYKQTNPYVPSKTIHIDLAKSEAQLLNEMSQKTRYNIKVANKNQVTVKVSNDIHWFVKFWNKCSLERGNFPQTKEITVLYNAFQKKAYILKAQNFKSNNNYINPSGEGELLASILLIIADGVAYYMYAASSKEGKRLFAPTLLVWEAIKFAQKKDVKVFDFEGIYDDRFPLPSWRGFTKFKLSFGGIEVKHPGAFTKWRLPI